MDKSTSSTKITSQVTFSFPFSPRTARTLLRKLEKSKKASPLLLATPFGKSTRTLQEIQIYFEKGIPILRLIYIGQNELESTSKLRMDFELKGKNLSLITPLII